MFFNKNKTKMITFFNFDIIDVNNKYHESF